MPVPWRKRIVAPLPPLGLEFSSRSLHVGFVVDERDLYKFSSRFLPFPLPQISFRNFSTLISFINIIVHCDGATGVVGRHPCYLTLQCRGLVASPPSTRRSVVGLHLLRKRRTTSEFLLENNFSSDRNYLERSNHE